MASSHVYTTLVPYMRQWFRIYNNHLLIQGLLPSWFYGLIGLDGLRQIERQRHCRFPHLEKALPRLAPRPLLMIHGEADTYIKPEMAGALFDLRPRAEGIVARRRRQAQPGPASGRRRVSAAACWRFSSSTWRRSTRTESDLANDIRRAKPKTESNRSDTQRKLSATRPRGRTLILSSSSDLRSIASTARRLCQP